MIWIIWLIVGAILIKLGALSVMVSVQALGLKAALAIFIVIAGYALWRKLSQ